MMEKRIESVHDEKFTKFSGRLIEKVTFETQ